MRVCAWPVAAVLVLTLAARGEAAWGEAKDGLKLGIEYVSGAEGGVVRVLVRNVSSIAKDPEAGHEGLGGVREFAQFWAVRGDGAGGEIRVFDRPLLRASTEGAMIPVGLYVGAGETKVITFTVKDLVYLSGDKLVPFAALLRQGSRLRVNGFFQSGLLRIDTPWISAVGVPRR